MSFQLYLSLDKSLNLFDLKRTWWAQELHFKVMSRREVYVSYWDSIQQREVIKPRFFGDEEISVLFS